MDLWVWALSVSIKIFNHHCCNEYTIDDMIYLHYRNSMTVTSHGNGTPKFLIMQYKSSGVG